MPFKLTIKKKLGSNKASKERVKVNDTSLLTILQKQGLNGSKQNRNLKLIRDHKKVEPIAFYQQPEINSTRRRPGGDNKNRLNFNIKQPDQQTIKPKYYNSTILHKNPHEESQDASLEHHNMSARTLETKGSFKNLKHNFGSNERKKSVKRRMNQTTSIEGKQSAKRSPISSERRGQGPIFIKRKITKQVMSNVYQTNVSNLKSRGAQSLEKLQTPSNRLHTSRHYK